MRTSLLWPALTALALSGCSVGHTEYSRTALQHVDMSVTGIPTVLGLGILGTTIPLTPEYSLTAAHVAKTAVQRVKAYHPYCDVAIIYHKNSPDTLAKFRSSAVGEPIKMYGYSFISAMPVESSGVNLARTAINNRWNKKPCMAMASDAGVVQGMSGGAVYNADQTISGVIVGYSHEIANVRSKKVILKDVSLYIPYGDFKRWLEANIGQTPQTAPGPA
ncbi:MULTISPECIES: serine protease family protein [Pantoea]|uniref:serine protease n=1 Tax=Pantoea TaxID=53335 RepID=UPI0018ED5E0D|nr:MULTISPECIES: serine protease [Pantoea]MCI1026825.1 serine protease [Pantoea dispersa]MDI6956203.1 serine protease [Pantoea sp. Pa-EAmG]